jgi:hypothetical protein
VFVWQPQIETLQFKPPYQGQLLRDGKPIGAQFKVTVTHLAITNGIVYCLVRNNAPEHLFDEGWYSDIDEVYFHREQVK